MTFSRRAVVVFALLACYLAVSVAPVGALQTNGEQLVVGSEHTTANDFEAGTFDGTAVAGTGTAASVVLSAEGTLTDDDFATFDSSQWTLHSQASYDSADEHVELLSSSEGNAEGELERDAGTPSGAFNVTWNFTGHSGRGWHRFAFYADGIDAHTAEDPSEFSNGFLLTYALADNEVSLSKRMDGGGVTLDSTSLTTGDAILTVEVRPTENRIAVYQNGEKVLENSSVTFDTGYSRMGWSGSHFSAGEKNVDDIAVKTVGTGSGSYISPTHDVTNPEEARANLTLANASATVTWQANDGTGWSNVTSSTYTTGGQKTADVSAVDADQWRAYVSFESTGENPTAELDDDTILFTDHAPTVDNSTASPTGDLTTQNPTFEIDVSDPEFETAQDDEVTATLYVDGEAVGSDTLTANGTASVSHTLSAGGEHSYYWTVEDSYGLSSQSQSVTIASPSTLRVFNESAPSQLVDNATVELRMFVNETGTVQVFERNTTDGMINMTGLPADKPFIVVASADGYHTRRIFVPSLYETQSIYLLPSDEPVTDTIFQIDDYTGNFNSDDTVLLVQRTLNGSYETVLGDYFGATEQFPAELASNARYRLVLHNVVTGEERVAGTYTPITSSTQTVVVTPKGVSTIEGEPPSVVLKPQVRRLPALDGANLAVTVREGDMTVTDYRVNATLRNASSNTTVWTTSNAGPGSQSTSLDLDGHHSQTLVVNVTWNTSAGLSATETFEISLTEAIGNDHSLLDGIGQLATLSPPGDAREAFTGFLAMLITVLVIAGVGSMQPSGEVAGFAGILMLTGFSVIGFGVTYDVVFVACVGFFAFGAIRRGL